MRISNNKTLFVTAFKNSNQAGFQNFKFSQIITVFKNLNFTKYIVSIFFLTKFECVLKHLNN